MPSATWSVMQCKHTGTVAKLAHGNQTLKFGWMRRQLRCRELCCQAQPGIVGIVLLAIFVPIFGALAAIVGWYFRLQRHRADAVAMASYRKLAEEAVAGMAGLRGEMAKLSEHVSAVEQLMRDVG